MIKRFCVTTTFTVVVLVTGIFAYLHGYLRFNYPDRSLYPVMGIDVSHHQGDIDWLSLKSQKNIGFAYIKATEGGDFVDPKFHKNWVEASGAGIPRGAYHFFTFCRSGKEQADNFIKTVPAESGALPPVIDFEFTGNCSRRPSKDKMLKEVFACANAIEEHYAHKPIFYVTYNSYRTYLDGGIDDYQIWIRDILMHPSAKKIPDWIFWQYADHARINGIKGPVDLDVFRGNGKAFQILLEKR
ncbi:glycoside hydrolase family 25 protein [bacterium]|nr:glycoside hydrolase family 25 protein [candidate division CSSED10-310 bacterium]